MSIVTKDPETKKFIKKLQIRLFRLERVDHCLEEIFGLKYQSGEDYQFALRLLNPNVVKQLDRVVDFYYNKSEVRAPRTYRYYPEEIPAVLNSAAIEAEMRGKLENARDLYILSGYAYSHRKDEGALWAVRGNLGVLLRKLKDENKPRMFPPWYKIN